MKRTQFDVFEKYKPEAQVLMLRFSCNLRGFQAEIIKEECECEIPQYKLEAQASGD